MLDTLLLADAWLRAWAVTHHAPWLDAVMWTASAVGRAGMVWLALGFVAAALRRRLAPLAWQLVLVVLVAHGIVDWIVKPAVARSRPFEALADVRVVGGRPTTSSFPSGHAAEAFAGAFVLSLMIPRWRAAIWVLAVLVAVSRVYVGVHYPLDVLVGSVLGTAVGVLVTGGRACYIRKSSVASPLVAR